MKISKRWIERGARFGHVTKGVLYGLIGILALMVAFRVGGQVAGGEEAARFIGQQPFGRVLLLLIGVGLSGYSVWRLLEAINDPEHKGSEGGRLGERAASLASGLVNGALALAAFQMALGQSSDGSARSWVGQVLAQPFGAVLIGIVGASIVAVGVMQLYKAYSRKFLKDFRWQAMSPDEQRWITRTGQLGYSARGIVFPIIGVGFLRAALDQDPSRTRTTRDALLEIAHSSAGQILLGLVAAGFVAFGLFMVASARYRNIPC